jgi:hypothetical protein
MNELNPYKDTKNKNPELALRLMRRAGHAIDDAERAGASPERIAQLKARRAAAARVFVHHTAHLSALELRTLMRQANTDR